MEIKSADPISNSSNVTHIRPYQLLKIDDRFGEEINFFMPQAQGQGSISTLESILLIKLMRIVDASCIFEFGTYKGLTTRLLLENLPDKDVAGERIFTLDLPAIDGIAFQGTDIEVAKEAMRFQRKYELSKNRKLVKQLLQDCLTLDESRFLKKFQLIFIDGNHAITYAKSDTEKAFKMLADGPSCLAWHDYGNPQFPELTAYIEDLAKDRAIYHVEDTMFAFHLQGRNVPPRNPT